MKSAKDDIDWARCARFSFYGGLYVAPTLYFRVRVSLKLFPQANFRSAVSKGILEQFRGYWSTPAAMTSFYFLMTLLEGKHIEQAVDEVKKKFWPTYKAAMCVWRLVSTFNFAIVPEKNRVVFISICSLLWTTFLAYMKQLDQQNEKTVSSSQFENNNK